MSRLGSAPASSLPPPIHSMCPSTSTHSHHHTAHKSNGKPRNKNNQMWASRAMSARKMFRQKEGQHLAYELKRASAVKDLL